MKISIRAILLLAIFTLSACASIRSDEPAVKRDIVFKSVSGENLKLDVYQPRRSGLKPAVIVVHGGGWNRRFGDMTYICRHLAANGYVVFNTTYRMAPAHLYPKAVDDVRDAMIWIKEHAADYEVDTKRIGGWGYSAGSNLVLLAGLDPSRELKALVAGGTPADLTAWPESPLVTTFIGAKMKEKPDVWKEASPVNHVDAKSPPLFLYHGETDELVEPEQMRRMKVALDAKNVLSETYTVSSLGHITTYFFSQESLDRGTAFLNKQLK